MDEAIDRLGLAGCNVIDWDWLDEGDAADIVFTGDLKAAREAIGIGHQLDVVVQPAANRKKRLLAADMDSTIITGECIDELADYAGVKAQVAAITERAMAGQLPFEAALRERVALLAGLGEDVLARCYGERVRLTPGAETLVRTMKRDGAHCVLVSGGFTYFADRVAAAAGFDRAISNRLVLSRGKLTGEVEPPLVGAAGKRQALLDAAAAHDLDLADTLAIGDGANDIPMLEAAGLGVAYRAKPAVTAAAGARVEFGDLTALLFAQGYPRSEWAI